jgi:hypothetical protein
VGSFDLFELASNGAKTKVLVTFPVDAAEVAQDGGEDRTGPDPDLCLPLSNLSIRVPL